MLIQLLGEFKKLKTSDSESTESAEKFIMHIQTVFYNVQIFAMQTGIYTTTTHGKYMTYTHTHPVTRDYAFLFREDSLLFWGYPHEFARSSNPFVRSIGKEALRRHVK